MPHLGLCSTPLRGRVPDVIGFSSAISASEKRRQWRVAVRLLEARLVECSANGPVAIAKLFEISQQNQHKILPDCFFLPQSGHIGLPETQMLTILSPTCAFPNDSGCETSGDAGS